MSCERRKEGGKGEKWGDGVSRGIISEWVLPCGWHDGEKSSLGSAGKRAAEAMVRTDGWLSALVESGKPCLSMMGTGGMGRRSIEWC